MKKRGDLWFIAEAWSWIAMFLIILVFVILFRACTKPTLQVTLGQQTAALDSRQEALFVLDTPVSYRGQNVTIGYLATLGETPGGMAAVSPTIELALARLGERMSRSYALTINYAAQNTATQIPANTGGATGAQLDTIQLPTATGATVKITVRAFQKSSQNKEPTSMPTAGLLG